MPEWGRSPMRRFRKRIRPMDCSCDWADGERRLRSA